MKEENLIAIYEIIAYLNTVLDDFDDCINHGKSKALAKNYARSLRIGIKAIKKNLPPLD